MLGFYNYTVILTYIGLFGTAMGIFSALNGRITLAILCLLFSGICDMFDGKIARTKTDRTDDEKRFGIQIDSLCDLVCFNVFPAILGFAVGVRTLAGYVILALYMLCGVIRLAYFNVMEENRQKETDLKRKVYTGLPVTFSAFVVPVFLAFRGFMGDHLSFLYLVLLSVLGLLQLSHIKVRKPGKGDEKVREF
ncbi:MAG: CDP-alcohol phosphatidyltransferase family protein [Clostridia bacterium]|nr:CDP-alcohol phosphatidyltransferase family protein [Clostridia bacterium]